MNPENENLTEVNSIPGKTPFLNKKLIFIVVFVLAFLLISFFAMLFLNNNNAPQKPTTKTTPASTISPNGEIELTLEKNKEVQVTGTNLFLTLTDFFIPDSQCADCISSTTIVSREGNEKTTLSYSCGGFAGKCLEDLSSYGYSIKLKVTKNNSAQVQVKKLQ